VSEEEEAKTPGTSSPFRDSSDLDDDTFRWLDENYGAEPRATVVSPTRSPLERFKLLGKMVKNEITTCRNLGIGVDSDSLKNFGTSSLAADSMSSLVQTALASPRVMVLMETCWDITEFDIFQLAALNEVRGHVVVVFGAYLSQHFEWLTRYHLPVDKFHNFLKAIQEAYNHLPYHNKIHAIDVTHTMMYLCRTSMLANHLSELDQLACFVAAVIHDVAHTGQTNQYHMNSQSLLAIRYNDHSVLENFHLATAFQLLKDPQNNFLEPLTSKEYRYTRDAIITMVLGTDMSNHQKQLHKLEKFSKIIESQNFFDLQQTPDVIPRIHGVSNEKLFLMELALHLCDISNPCKKTSVSVEWTKRITEEFYAQGDKEKEQNLPVSAGCDRDAHKSMANQSIGFIDFIVQPLWTAFRTMDSKSEKMLQQIQRNRTHWLTEARAEAERAVHEELLSRNTITRAQPQSSSEPAL